MPACCPDDRQLQPPAALAAGGRRRARPEAKAVTGCRWPARWARARTAVGGRASGHQPSRRPLVAGWWQCWWPAAAQPVAGDAAAGAPASPVVEEVFGNKEFTKTCRSSCWIGTGIAGSGEICRKMQKNANMSKYANKICNYMSKYAIYMHLNVQFICI